MEGLLAVAQYTLKEHIRNRVYLTVILFGVILLGSGIIVSSLAADQQLHMMVNIGLNGIEFLALIAVVFVTVSLVLEEIESRSIYLVLSHPIERWQYILGRYLGTVTALSLGIIAMAILHLASLYWHQWSWQPFYLIAIGCSIAKIAVVGALALLVSLITTSTASSMTLTGFLWVMGHFSGELNFMADKSTNAVVKSVVWVFQHLAPNFSYYNYRDFWQATQAPSASWFGWMGVYTLSYIFVALFLTSWLFSKREV